MDKDNLSWFDVPLEERMKKEYGVTYTHRCDRLYKVASIYRTANRFVMSHYAKKGIRDERLVYEWASIVGPTLAKSCHVSYIKWPHHKNKETRFSRGILYVRLSGGGTAVNFHYSKEDIIHRINALLGPSTIVDIKVQQGSEYKVVEVPDFDF